MFRWIAPFLLCCTYSLAQTAWDLGGMRAELSLNDTVFLEGDRVLLKVKIESHLPIQLIEEGSTLTLTRTEEGSEKALLKTNIHFSKIWSREEQKAWAFCGVRNRTNTTLTKADKERVKWTKKGFLVLDANNTVGCSKYLDEFSFYGTEEETFYKSKPDADGVTHNFLRPGHYTFTLALVTGKKRKISRRSISFVVRNG